MKQQVTMELDIPEGFEATGEYREVQTQEWYADINSDHVRQWRCDGPSSSEYLILRKLLPPAPKYIPFTHETFPWPKKDVLVRTKARPEGIASVYGTRPTHARFTCNHATWQSLFDDYEISLDRGETWQPAGIKQ